MVQAITEALEKFSEGALCQWLNQPGSANAVSVLAAGAIAVPDPITTAAGLGLLATQLGCSFNSNGDPSTPPYPGEFCFEGESDFQIRSLTNGEITSNGTPVVRKLDSVLFIESDVDLDGNTYDIFEFQWTKSNGVSGTTRLRESTGSNPIWVFRQDWVGSSACVVPGPPKPKPPGLEPIVGDSPELNCKLEAELYSWLQDPSGNILPVIKYKSLGDTGTRASGGIISGCNWYGDLIYVGGEGCKCPTVAPLPPGPPGPPDGPGIPDWLQDILSGLGAEFIKDFIDSALEMPQPPINYTMTAPCNYDDKGEPLVWEEKIPLAYGIDALGLRITAIHNQISQHLLWKTPICNEQPTREGDFRTINFRSASPSPYSSSRLRKRFRYRSTSGLGLGEIVDYWKDFTFESGPYRVRHVGSAWGSPEVWAASEDEGKRVIRHAAGEAGINPDQVGRWAIGSSSSSRFGVSDTMKVDTTGGYYWITSRDGSDNRPVVALTSDL